jgi:hypothetical protein
MTDKKKPVVKKKAIKKTVEKPLVKKPAGKPSKVNELLKDESWNKIEEYMEYMMSREAICQFMGCNKDTLLKVVKAKGFDSFIDFKNKTAQHFRFQMKKKVFSDVKNGVASDKIKIYYMDNYVLPFEEFNQKTEENENVKIVVLPVADFGSPEKLQDAIVKQQQGMIEKMQEHERKLEEDIAQDKENAKTGEDQ